LKYVTQTGQNLGIKYYLLPLRSPLYFWPINEW
jgi:hypothetical protein